MKAKSLIEAYDRTEYAAKRDELSSVRRDFDNLIARLKDLGLASPGFTELQQLRDQVTKLGIKPPEGKIVTGPVATVSQLKRMLTGASGHSRWELMPYEAREDEDPDDNPAGWLLSEYGIKVDPKQVKRYRFFRDTDNRSELCVASFVVAPGVVAVTDLANDRVSGFSGVFKDTAAAAEYIRSTF